MIYFKPTIVIRETDARELALLLGLRQHLEVTLPQIDDMMCDLCKHLAAKIAYIKSIKTNPPTCVWVSLPDIDDLQAERGRDLHIEEQETAADRYRMAMTSLKRIREPLIGMTEIAWTLEDQRGWGLNELEALRLSCQQEARQELNRGYEEPDRDEAFVPSLST